ncbi:MAG: hypothetical protein N4Q03_00450, partial [Candidatus Lightella neohaematopini]|nr:hypothetical protein [Candidatus Lightella neohaematopini]
LVINNIILSKNIINDKQIENITTKIIKDINIDDINFFTPKIRFNFVKNQIYQIILNRQIINYIIHNTIISTQEVDILSKQIINKYFHKIRVKLSYFIINLLQHTSNKIKMMYIINNSIDYSNNCLHFNKLTYLINNKLINIKKYNNNNWQSIDSIPFLIKKHIKKIYKNILIGPICTKNKIYFVKINNICKLDRNILNNKIYIIRYVIINWKYFNNNLLIRNFNKLRKQIYSKNINFYDILNRLVFGNKNFYITGIWFSNISYVHPVIKKVILNMNINDISSPIKIKHNWYIIQLLDTYNENNNFLRKYSYLVILKRYLSEIRKFFINTQYNQSYINSNINNYE